MARKVAVLRGDGIGPEVVTEAIKVLRAVGGDWEFQEALVGGAAYDDCGQPLPPATLDLCKASEAVLFGAVGGPQYDKIQPPEMRPEVGALLPLRRELNLYANIRPAKTFRALLDASPLKGENGLIDLIVMRELTGGIYFAPRHREDEGNRAVDQCIYNRFEVERIARRGFEIARTRTKKLVSVDKANVLETSRLWRETVIEIARDYPDVELSHLLVDNCAMQLVRSPRQFDVILTENMFGDILSDEASVITGSLGLLPSASLSDPKDGRVFGMYEPIHGSAPDIAGQQRANPLAAILSAAMMARFSYGDSATADRIEAAVERALDAGLRTPDIATEGTQTVPTAAMGDAVVAAL